MKNKRVPTTDRRARRIQPRKKSSFPLMITAMVVVAITFFALLALYSSSKSLTSSHKRDVTVSPPDAEDSMPETTDGSRHVTNSELARPDATGASHATQPSELIHDTKFLSDQNDSDNMIQWSNEGSIANAMHSKSITESAIHSGSFSFPSKVKGCPSIVCDYRIPTDQSGKPLPCAADLVAVFPYPKETNAVDDTASVLATHYGFTIFSLRFPGMENESGEDTSTFYYYPASGSGEAYLTAADKVRSIAKFPKRKLFLTGRSGGGSAAQLFANAYPTEVEAVSQEAAQVYPENITFKGPMLITYGEHDYISQVVAGFENKLSSSGVNHACISFRPNWGMRGQGPLWTHGQYDTQPDLLYYWIMDMANLRSENGGGMPGADKWIREGGLLFPGDASLSRWREFGPHLDSVSTHSGIAKVARVKPNQHRSALVILIVHDMAEDLDECTFDIEQMADCGIEGILVENSRCGSEALQAVQAEEKSSPIFLVSYGAIDSDLDLIKDSDVKSSEWIVFGMPSINKSKVISGTKGVQLIIVRSSDSVKSDNSTNIRSVVLTPGGNIAMTHSKRVALIADLVQKYLNTMK